MQEYAPAERGANSSDTLVVFEGRLPAQVRFAVTIEDGLRIERTAAGDHFL